MSLSKINNLKSDLQEIAPLNKLPVIFFLRFWSAPFKLCLNFFIRFILAALLLMLIYESYTEFTRSFIWGENNGYAYLFDEEINLIFINKYLISSVDLFLFFLLSAFVVSIKQYNKGNKFSIKRVLARIVSWGKKISVLSGFYFLPILAIFSLSKLLGLTDTINNSWVAQLTLSVFLFVLLSFVVFAPLLLYVKPNLTVMQSVVLTVNAFYRNVISIVLFVCTQFLLLIIGLKFVEKILSVFMQPDHLLTVFIFIGFLYLYGILSVLFIEIFVANED